MLSSPLEGVPCRPGPAVTLSGLTLTGGHGGLRVEAAEIVADLLVDTVLAVPTLYLPEAVTEE